MPEPAIIGSLFRYNDHANDLILAAAGPREDARLDQTFEIGRGTMRRNLMHIVEGERVWLARWQGQVEAKWSDEREHVTVGQLVDRAAAVRTQRDAFLGGLGPDDLARKMTYRDSLGGLFSTSLGDMIVQMFVHSTHHRAQTVNMLRQCGVKPLEVDYMMSVRKPV